MMPILLSVAVWAAQAAQIDRLVQQLGSLSFREREAASKALRAIGKAAWPALLKANANTRDAEVRRRLEPLVVQAEDDAAFNAVLSWWKTWLATNSTWWERCEDNSGPLVFAPVAVKSEYLRPFNGEFLESHLTNENQLVRRIARDLLAMRKSAFRRESQAMATWGSGNTATEFRCYFVDRDSASSARR